MNLGIGMPELVANYIPDDREIVFHSENGILGMGEPRPTKWITTINAGKKPAPCCPAASPCGPFGMIRGGHIDMRSGAFQVSAVGDLANWSTGGPDAVPAVVAHDEGRARKVLVDGSQHQEGRFQDRCRLLLPDRAGVVNTVYTDIAVIDILEGGPNVREKVAGVSFDELRRTGTELAGADTCDSAPDVG